MAGDENPPPWETYQPFFRRPRSLVEPYKEQIILISATGVHSSSSGPYSFYTFHLVVLMAVSLCFLRQELQRHAKELHLQSKLGLDNTRHATTVQAAFSAGYTWKFFPVVDKVFQKYRNHVLHRSDLFSRRMRLGFKNEMGGCWNQFFRGLFLF